MNDDDNVVARDSSDRHGPDFGESIFVCSKPLQVLNCASIVRHYKISSAELNVYVRDIDDHLGFKAFFETSEHARLFKNANWFQDASEVANELQTKSYDSLFIEDDRVSFYHLFAPLKNKWMILFEEGLGTYRGHYRYSFGFFRKVRWKASALFSGSGFEFGSGRETDFILVQRPDLFKRLNPKTSHKVLPFPGLLHELGMDSQNWFNLASESLNFEISREDTVCLILGTRDGASGINSETLVEEYGHLIFKPHPGDKISLVEGAFVVAKSWIPAEILVEYLAQKCRHLTVIHFSSSASLYSHQQQENISFNNLREHSHVADIRFS